MYRLVELFNCPARLKPVQVNKAPGSVHHSPLLFLFTEGKDVDYWQYAQGIKDEKTDKLGKVSISACPPQGNPLPRQLPRH
jgi:uncharacterized protein YegL